MWPYILVLVFALLILAAIWSERKKHRDASANLRHTIRVNLSILKPELVELSAIAAATQTQEAQQAQALLESAQTTVATVEPKIDSASRKELGSLLSNVFEAMNKAVDARHLLNACVPMEWL